MKHGRIILLVFLIFVLSASSGVSFVSFSVNAQPPAAYQIALSVDKTECFWGESVRVEGYVSPSPSQPVTVVFSEPYKGLSESVNVSALNSVFSVSYTPSTVGYWRISAYVAGAEFQSESNVVEVVVRYHSQTREISIYDGLPPEFHRCIVNETYARGRSWSVRLESGVFRWRSEPTWVWSEAEQRYVPYIFIDRYETDGYYQVQSGLIGARIYDYYAVFYDPNCSEVRVHDERWEVQQLDKNGKWSDVGAQSGTPVFSISQSENCINITKAFHSWAGWLNITYVFREGSPLKHQVIFQAEIEGTFRIVQRWSGIQAAKVRHFQFSL